MKKVLITGANGQLGKALGFDVPMGYEVLMAGRDALDITDRQSVFDFFSANELDGVINAAAYTAVDKAESEHEMADLVNAQGAHLWRLPPESILSRWCRYPLILFSMGSRERRIDQMMLPDR